MKSFHDYGQQTACASARQGEWDAYDSSQGLFFVAFDLDSCEQRVVGVTSQVVLPRMVVKMHMECVVLDVGFVFAEKEIRLSDENDAWDGEYYGDQERDGELFFEKNASEEGSDNHVGVDQSDAVRGRDQENGKVPSDQTHDAQDGSAGEKASDITGAQDVDAFDLAKDEHGRDLEQVNERSLFTSIEVDSLSGADIDHGQEHAGYQSQQ